MTLIPWLQNIIIIESSTLSEYPQSLFMELSWIELMICESDDQFFHKLDKPYPLLPLEVSYNFLICEIAKLKNKKFDTISTKNKLFFNFI